jgi:glucose/arabinose dehydrogenase
MIQIKKAHLLLTLTALGAFVIAPFVAEAIHENNFLNRLKLPEGFNISIFADSLKGPRLMAANPQGILHVTLTRAGMVMALPDKDNNGVADIKVTVATGLHNPHGIVFYRGYVYIAETGRVLRFKQDPDSLEFIDKKVIVKQLPTKGGGHFTRTLALGPDGKLYLSIGSSCNLCEEDDRRRAAVMRFNPDGSGQEIFAEGLRNTVGLAFHPLTGELFGTDNARDWLGDDLPPDEVNIIKKDAHFGWPFCYGKKIADPEYNRVGFCGSTQSPSIEIQAHSAPLGLTFYNGKTFPTPYRGGLFIALHGSWNRSEPTGYKIVSAKLKSDIPVGTYEDFITGWLDDKKVHGKPVDVFVSEKGALLISDDKSGLIYLVSYKGR